MIPKKHYTQFWDKKDSMTKHNKHSILIALINTTLFLLAINLLSNNLGMIIDNTAVLLLTTYLLLATIIFNIPAKKIILPILLILKKTEKKKHKKQHTASQTAIGTTIIIISFFILLTAKTQILQISTIPLLILGLNLLLHGIQIERKELHILLATTLTYTLVYTLTQTIPPIWHFTQYLSISSSIMVGIVINRPLLLGSSASGLWILIVFLIQCITIFYMTYEKKKPSWSYIIRFLSILFSLVILWMSYIALSTMPELGLKNIFINPHYILFIFLLIPSLIYLAKSIEESSLRETPHFMLNLQNIKPQTILRNMLTWTLILFFVSILLLTLFLPAEQEHNNSGKKILFYGENMLGTWDLPCYGKYGRESSGMFGLLPVYLNKSGYNVEIMVENKTMFLLKNQPEYENITRYVNITDYITLLECSEVKTDVLKDVDVFIVVNLNTSFSQTEKKAIIYFIEQGGSLLVMGDHTNVGGIQKPLNDLLQPFGIRYKFDSALPLHTQHRWIPCYHLPHNPVIYNIDSMDEIQISVGASLDTNWFVSPTIIGRYGFSDKGNPLNSEMAYLGDYEYNPGEHLGDIILAATAYHGKGRVLVFGDTSPFQNTAIPYSYPLIDNVFIWLTSQKTGTMKHIQNIISLSLLSIILILHIVSPRKNKTKKSPYPVLPLFSIILIVAMTTSTAINSVTTKNNVPELDDNIVYIDVSHGERFNLQFFTDDSLSGLMLNLMRNNYLPLLLRELSWNKISNANMLIFNAPTKSFTSTEIDLIKQYMEKGGIVILSAGYEDKYPLFPLLQNLQLDIQDIPLGPVPYVESNTEEFEDKPRFVDSWPIIYDEKNNAYRSFYNFTLSYWDQTYHLMVFVKHGKGGLLLISDSQFLLDKNIESIYDYWPGNIVFLKHILDELKQETGGS
ncbi:MAG: hypothetical protein DRN08_00740 [Thermoplasmata archaeon]|nr:MAG: hypothetical protein DRN08_00740 [Thermoplasmata archaeon]